jgi:AcrR family transcriptional regulator
MARTAAPGSRERILRTAAGLFYTRGVRAVGMAQVIDEAGCGKNLLYGHFPSKTDLVAAYLQDVRDHRERATARVLAAVPDDDPAAALVALTAEIAGMIGRDGYRGCAFRNYLTEFPEGDDVPGHIAHDYLRTARKRVDGLVAQLDVDDASLLTDRIWLILEGLYATAGRPDAPHQATAAVQFVTDLVKPQR